MTDILGLKNILKKPIVTLEDLDKLVEETKQALRDAEDIYIRAEQNVFEAARSYDRAVLLRDKYANLQKGVY